MNVVAGAVELLGQLLALFLCLLELHAEQRRQEVAELQVEMKDLLLALSEQHTVPLVERQGGVRIIFSQNLDVLLQSLRVLVQRFCAHFLDVGEHLGFVLQRDNANVFGLPTRDLRVVAVILVILFLLFTRLRLHHDHHVALVLYEAHVGEEPVRLILREVCHHAVGTFAHRGAEQLILLGPQRVSSLELKLEWELIRIIVQVNKAVVQEESRVALFAIRVKYLLATLNVLECVNHEAAPIIAILPRCLAGPSMIQHVCVSDEGIRLMILDRDAKNT